VEIPAWTGWQHFLSPYRVIIIIRSAVRNLGDHSGVADESTGPSS
jgi:hypothetical protein